KEVDVLGYTNADTSTPQLVEDDSFGLVGASHLGMSDSGLTDLSLQYGSEEIQDYVQNPDGSYASTPIVDAWNRVTNVSAFDAIGSSSPAAAPAASEVTAAAAASTTPAHLDYFVRFTLVDGDVVTLNGNGLFGLNSFSFADDQTLNIGSQTTGLGAGEVKFDPLTLTFSQGGLDPTLLNMLAAGSAFKEVDVLGYTNADTSTPQLVEDDSFGLVGASHLGVSDSGLTDLSLQYGSEEIEQFVACYCTGTSILTRSGDV